MTIDSEWTLEAVPSADIPPALELPPLPAEVPGYVHLDLHRAGVIPDPFYRLHERDVAWVDDADWTYTTTFQLESVPDGDVLLSFLGLDTIAEITLSGQSLGETDNMFMSHEFAVRHLLRGGANTLQITFRSARRVGRERHAAWSRDHVSMPPHHFLWDARSFVRKAQYMFGWDWGPVLISCGIWRPIEVVSVPTARILDWGYSADLEGDRGAVTLTVAVERAAAALNAPLTLTATIDGADSTSTDVPDGEGRLSVTLTVPIEGARLWSPEHPELYDLQLRLETGGTVIDTREGRIGLRRIELLREPDADRNGEGFRFRVNGEDVFCKGANWIPADSFPTRSYDERDRLRGLLVAAKEAGCNMLRIWGGGMYESDTFYDLCDELGILVWQDFPYACAYYPDDEKSLEVTAREAAAAVRRLRIHPSLVLWCGNNENQQMYHDNWMGLNPPHFLGAAIYDEVLPRVVAEEDPQRPYWPGSAFGGDNPNSPDVGDRHNWDVWHAHGESDGDWTYYARDLSRFCSEFGFASSCGAATWNTCLAPADHGPATPAVQWHTKTGKLYDTYLDYIDRHFPPVRTLADLVYYSQLNQAEAMKFGVEHYRRLKGRCWGTLIWQLNDCWPVQSWAMIDYLGEDKAAYYAARRFYAPVLLSLVRDGDVFDVVLVNDRSAPVRGRLIARLATFGGEVLNESSESVTLDAGGVAKIGRIDARGGHDRAREMFAYAALETDERGACAENIAFLVEPKELQLPDPGLRTAVTATAAGTTVTLEAKRFAAYVALSAPGLDPLPWSDNFFHLVPGRSHSVSFRGGVAVDGDILRQHLTVQSLAQPL